VAHIFEKTIHTAVYISLHYMYSDDKYDMNRKVIGDQHYIFFVQCAVSKNHRRND